MQTGTYRTHRDGGGGGLYCCGHVMDGRSRNVFPQTLASLQCWNGARSGQLGGGEKTLLCLTLYLSCDLGCSRRSKGQIRAKIMNGINEMKKKYVYLRTNAQPETQTIAYTFVSPTPIWALFLVDGVR